ncbi:MAG TPA: C10 family peptidase, partial [Planctomycetota bacterium]|nr:C10 family peptidase [Planctomycetota bacterium]
MERVDRRIFHALAGWGWRIASAGLLVLAGALAPAGQARAQTTTAADAEKAAGSWLKSRPRPLGAALGVEVASVKTYKDDRSEPVYHVVSLKSGGFLIVPAEDLVEPVVCFSPKGSFDPSERNPLGALADRDLRGRVKDARGREAAARGAGRELVPAGRMASAKRKWDRLRGGSSESAAAAGTEAGTGTISDPRVDALVQSKWDQEQVAGVDCYNYYTPGNYVCGCVATAMAQLMRFHQHPTAGVGTTSFSIEVNGTPTTRSLRGGNGSGGAYSWAQMVLIPSAGMTLTQRQAIGALTHDAGVSVNMSYTMLGSGADTLMAANRLTGTFGYANAIRGYNGGADLGAGLNGMLNPGLDAGLPSLLGITGPDGGHAIVCDGYGYDSSTLYHHLNMGWSGLDDAWYNLPDIGTTGFEFNTVYKCIYNVYPSGTGEIVSGRVTDAGGLPLSGVSISAVRSGGGTYTATTNARGIYALARIPSGSSYTVSASKDGYTFSSQAVSTGTSAHNAATSGNYWGLNFTPAGGSPVLALSPGALSFSAQIGVNPDAKGAVVTNTGTGTLRWSAWSDKPWLQVAPTWGTTTIESDALAVSAVVAQTESWSATATAGAAAAREDHSAVWTGREMIIWGGNTDYAHNPTNTGAKYDPAADAWTGTVSTTGAPSGRRRHSAAWTGSEMIVWGGWDLTNSYLADGYRYNPVTDAWSSGVTATNAPSARRSHTAVWTGSEMIVWGGQVAGDGVTNTGARYNPTANTWTAVTTTGAPTARRDHVAVWTGTETETRNSLPPPQA